MSFKINYKGLEVICETVDDVDALAERYNKGVLKKQVTTNSKNIESASLFDETKESKPALESLIESFSVNAKRLLRVLAGASEPLSDDEIAEQMSAQKSSIAGYISDIALKSQRMDYDYSAFFVRQLVSDKQGEREYATEIPQNMQERVLKALSA